MVNKRSMLRSQKANLFLITSYSQKHERIPHCCNEIEIFDYACIAYHVIFKLQGVPCQTILLSL